MNLTRALAFLFGASLKNRVLRHLRRMRQPRFLIATLVGVFYLWQVIIRRWFLFTRPLPTSPAWELVRGNLRPAVELVLIVLALVQVLGAWFFGDERATLAFTEAEVHFFFPAPATRMALVHYKLLRGLMWLILGALITMGVLGRAVSHTPLLFTAGAWIALSTIYFHRIAASFTRERLASRGSWLRYVVWGVLGCVLLVLGSGAWSVLHYAAVPTNAEDLGELARRVLEEPTTAWLISPVRALIRLPLAPNGAAFVRALPPALLVLVLQYIWVVATVTPFEEASAAAAEVRTRMLQSRLSRGSTPERMTFRRMVWTLPGAGPPEWALAWKNGLAVLRQFQVRGGFILGVVILVGSLVVAVSGGGGSRMVLGPTLASFAVAVVLMGPIRMNLDVRHDLRRLDILRAWPLSGRQIVLAELIAPLAVLAILEWLLLAAGVGLSGDLGGLSVRARASIALSAALLAPALTLIGMLVQSAAALLFPEWMAVFRERRRGLDAMGQRLLTLVGSAIVLAVGAVPAAIVGLLCWVLLWTPLEWGALPLAAILATAVLIVEAALGANLVGKLFEAHDVSSAT